LIDNAPVPFKHKAIDLIDLRSTAVTKFALATVQNVVGFALAINAFLGGVVEWFLDARDLGDGVGGTNATAVGRADLGWRRRRTHESVALDTTIHGRSGRAQVERLGAAIDHLLTAKVVAGTVGPVLFVVLDC
jgi:hypothetical protein